MPIDLYYTNGSPPSNSVRFLATYMGLDLNLKFLDYEKKEHKTPEFIKINPQHTLPTINDNGFVVAESRAILGYLVDKYGNNDSLYPKDSKKRTLVNQRLYFDIGTLYQRFMDYYGPAFVTGKVGDESKLARIEEAFHILNTYLDGQKWVAGEDLTIADFSIASSVATFDAVGGFNGTKYQNVSKWFANTKKLTGYDVIQSGSDIIKAYYEKCKK